ncbi:glutamine--fructose-6-phosphate transaminase (isomerizing) [Wenzhouxiangella marina]|uniref:Glutamine--fructose-6-phosphate aminotransferase [isomerizing] n=1 Tax=Wenzhouxiangella marina TaxID=1579979 RepID=A0A0K0Y092_9GAMM|nr:glutamine--fructose-6-phosphate transaminase (isomerizing) [Wenzhouxiangella marina]AKS43335.1 Glutamine--fructose-6-phosphate aminotransferase [Wenzhouxiangella marina]MBB6088550.1 glucosamine--fructose-6-phosphate aminotransferase (isomerizing) [Wenzhouxiangella marina]
MCGIVAANAERNIIPILLDGLKRLEYRGYDSAGLACLTEDGELYDHTEVGKVAKMAAGLPAELSSHLGIAHTRWATHGAPSRENAHPHLSGQRVAVVHNGIIENFSELRQQLQDRGYEFSSETDSEVIAHLIDHELTAHASPLQAIRQALKQLDGAYAIAVILHDYPDRIFGARQGSPLVVGVGVGENFLASDAAALVPVTQQMMFLEDGDLVELKRAEARVIRMDGESVERPVRISSLPSDSADRGRYRHFMEKEIHEQPEAIATTLNAHLDGTRICPSLDPELLGRVRAIHILACGTSYHAGLVARYWIERLARVPVSVEIASEYRYREPAIPEDTLLIAISQSGETADTLAALERAEHAGYLSTLGICNVPESALTRQCENVLMTRAGLEIGVASTKAFTTQLTVLLLFAAALAKAREADPGMIRQVLEDLGQASQQAREVLAMDGEVQQVAEEIASKAHALFLGRGPEYPIAMEGALKLKEISYIHAEAYAAGELKHGPLALVDDTLPVIVPASSNPLLTKLISNLQEVRARGGMLYVFADRGVSLAPAPGIRMIRVPAPHSIISPIIQVLPLQFLAYHVGVLKGTDVDQPRNLAKSVTVE